MVPIEKSNLQERATLIIGHIQGELGDKAFVLSNFYSLLLEFVKVVNIIEQNSRTESSKMVSSETLAQVCTSICIGHRECVWSYDL